MVCTVCMENGVCTEEAEPKRRIPFLMTFPSSSFSKNKSFLCRQENWSQQRPKVLWDSIADKGVGAHTSIHPIQSSGACKSDSLDNTGKGRGPRDAVLLHLAKMKRDATKKMKERRRRRIVWK